MAKTIFATFADANQAEKAAGALLDHGISSDDLSLVADERHHHARSQGHGDVVKVEGTEQETFADRDFPRADVPEGASTGLPHNQGAVPDHGLAGGPYSGSLGAISPLGMGSLGAVGPYSEQHNPGYDTTYEGARSSDLQDPEKKLPPTHSMDESPEVVPISGTTTTGVGAIPGGVQADQDQNDDLESAAKKGITTTTAKDAGSGAVKGAGVGLGVGAAAALVSLLVPGVGLVIGGGALAAALAGVAATTAGGAVAGGVVGYLKDQGVEETTAREYASAVEGGGALLSVRLPSDDVSEQEVRDLLLKYGAARSDIHADTGKGYVL